MDAARDGAGKLVEYANTDSVRLLNIFPAAAAGPGFCDFSRFSCSSEFNFESSRDRGLDFLGQAFPIMTLTG